MYKRIVGQLVVRAFQQLSRQDTATLLAKTTAEIEHTFPGNHALGGTRYTRAGFEQWLHRLFALFPDLRFELHDVLVAGPPWNTRVAVTWTDRGTTADGEDYVNSGVHILRLRWGKLIALRAYLDTQHLNEVVRHMADNGVQTAAKHPIGKSE